MEKFTVAIICILGSCFMFYEAYCAFTGRKKKWYFGFPSYHSVGDTTIGLGAGFFALMSGILILLPEGFLENHNIDYIFFSIYLIVPLISYVLLFIQPDFLKPEWVRWLESEYKPLIPLIKGHVRKIGYVNWEKQVQSDKELKDWVKNFAEDMKSKGRF